ncbi:MAG: LysR family transcriptional regulator [Oscillospiraceae bacterium]|nr:LysR family transcriptional regulator [Oscillospiraceae bacterium]MBR1565586.1 LysR family transcriptional regulator [Oscillospiraceae bacterium]
METKKLLALIEAVRIGSINKAAEELGYTQSGLSYILNALEDEIGVKILQRSHSGIFLTPDGERLFPYMEAIIERDTLFNDQVEQIKNGDRNVIRIGAYSSMVVNWLPTILHAFRLKHPEVTFEIKTGVKNLTQWLRDGEVDLVICEKFIADSPNWEYFADDEMCLAIHDKHPLAKKETITLEMLRDYHVIVPSLLQKNAVIRALKEKGIEYDDQTQIQTEDGSVTLSLVKSSKGVSFATKLYTPECPEGVHLRSLTPKIFRQIGVAVSDQARSNKSVNQFVRMLKKHEFVY